MWPLWNAVAALVALWFFVHWFRQDARARWLAHQRSLQARMRYQQASSHPHTIIESFPGGWMNLMLRVMWPGFLSNIGTGLVAQQLENVLNQLSSSLQNQPLTNSFVSQLKLLEVCLGCMPPTFHNITVRMHPDDSMMDFEFDIDWTTVGAHVLVAANAGVGDAKVRLRARAIELQMSGRMLMSFQFSKSVLPGIRGFNFCFLRRPHLSFDVDIRGYHVSEIPGLQAELKQRLLNIIVAEACAPAKVWVNLQTSFYHLVTRKQAGGHGQLLITLQCATDMKPVVHKAAAEGEGETEECMCFVELQALGRAWVSPVAAQGASPRWDWTYYLPLDKPPTGPGSPTLRFVLRNFMSRKQPQVVGEGTLELASLAADADLAGRIPHEARVKLKPPKGHMGGGGNLFISIAHHVPSATPDNSSSGTAAAATTAPTAPAGAADNLTAPPGAHAATGMGHAGAGAPMVRGVRRDEGAAAQYSGELVDRGREGEFGSGAAEVEQAGVDLGAAPGTIGAWQGREDMSALTMIASAANRMLHNAGGASVTTPMSPVWDAGDGSAALEAAKHKIEKLERLFSLAQSRRYEEELRALVEGAPFMMHRGKDCVQRWVWVAVDTEKRSSMVRWQKTNGLASNLAKLYQGSTRFSHKASYYEAPVPMMLGVKAGDELFPNAQFNSHSAATKMLAQRNDRCFSILVQVRGELPGEQSRVALHLEIPAHGNGRARNEWVMAFENLRLNLLPLYQNTMDQQS